MDCGLAEVEEKTVLDGVTRPGELGRSVPRPYMRGCAIGGGKTRRPAGASPAPTKEVWQSR